MKRVNVFLILQYISLAGTIAVQLIVASFISQEVKKFIPAMACIFLVVLVVLIIVCTLITETACVKKADSKAETNPQILIKVWKKLKLLTVPFYVINFIVYSLTASITFPVSLFLCPLDGLLCLIMIIISGIAGINSIKVLKRKGRKISGIHYVFQLLPVFDVLSTLSLKKYTK